MLIFSIPFHQRDECCACQCLLLLSVFGGYSLHALSWYKGRFHNHLKDADGTHQSVFPPSPPKDVSFCCFGSLLHGYDYYLSALMGSCVNYLPLNFPRNCKLNPDLEVALERGKSKVGTCIGLNKNDQFCRERETETETETKTIRKHFWIVMFGVLEPVHIVKVQDGDSERLTSRGVTLYDT